MTEGQILKAFIVPTLPHPLLAPERQAGWARLRDAMVRCGESIAKTDADLLMIYSTRWISVIGHQIQARPNPEWVHVDEEWHELGSIPYSFRMDTEFAASYQQAAKARGLHARTVDYHGFPIDTGSIAALKMLNPNNRIPACIVSCNMYADRSETVILGKALRDAVRSSGKKVVLVGATALSNRMFTTPIAPEKDAISSLKDDEWNRKILELLSQGRLEDVSQLARQLAKEANIDQKFKAVWWLSAASSRGNRFHGEIHAYEAIQGTGAAVVELTPSATAFGDQEYDEDDTEHFVGERNVLDPGAKAKHNGDHQAPALESSPRATAPTPSNQDANRNSNRDSNRDSIRDSKGDSKGDSNKDSHSQPIVTGNAPKPVGAYPHARRVGDLIFVSGIGPRNPQDNSIPGGPVRNAKGEPQPYDVRAQTHAVITNIRSILESCGASLSDVIDATCFLIDMDKDFAGFNEVYGEYFRQIQATRTTLAVTALPTPIAVEMKVIALSPTKGQAAD